MSRTVDVDAVIDCPSIGPGEATDRLLAEAGSRYRVTSVTSDSFEFHRRYRPFWATVLGILLIPVLVGIFVLIFVRRNEIWSASIEASHRVTQVRISGVLEPDVWNALNIALVGPPVTTEAKRFNRPVDEQGSVDRIATPVSVAEGLAGSRGWVPSGVPSTLASSQSGIPLDRGDMIESVPGIRSGPPMPANDEPPTPQPVSEATVYRNRLGGHPPGGSPGAVVVFDSGVRRSLDGAMVIGRSPSATGEFVGAVVEALPDRDRSVSKTHLGLRMHDERVVVVDLGSTNGTQVIRRDGSVVPVNSGQSVMLEPGDRVEFGERFLAVEGVGC